jgi:hypothetical protein
MPVDYRPGVALVVKREGQVEREPLVELLGTQEVLVMDPRLEDQEV